MPSQTPRRLSNRPSMGYATSPLLEKASTSMHRKASYNALIGEQPITPSSKLAAGDFEVGDVVNVPGDMFGTIKFIGSVNGKQGRFLGVELDRGFAARGKNNGDVEGVRYFRTSVPGAGIFLPVHRAERRYSPSASLEDNAEDSPETPTAASYQAKKAQMKSPGTPSVPKFSQTMGPGARPPSPQFKPKPRQSLPRPESPLRRVPDLRPAPSQQFSQSVRPGSRPPAVTARSATPKLSASVRGGAPPRPYSRTGSRLGHRSESVSESSDAGAARAAATPSYSHHMRSPSRLDRSGDELGSLQRQLRDKDRQLEEQAQQLMEMEVSLKEIQALIPNSSPSSSRKASLGENGDSESSSSATELRQVLREKNDKISTLVAEFDAHRADFRSTIETLESASDETVRMYESRIQELTGEMADLRENNTSQQEVETIAEQLKMLEELVAELEDGLEDARRGEAEARGEVEFLRGEVERGRSELKREREKAAAHTNGDGEEHDRALEMKDDEIRGLKAILHSVQSTDAEDEVDDERLRKGSSVYSLDPDEMRRLQDSLHKLEVQNAELETQLRREQEGRRSDAGSHMLSVTNGSRKPSHVSQVSEAARGYMDDAPRKASAAESAGHGDGTKCEACGGMGHDMLSCTLFGSANGQGGRLEVQDDAARTNSAVSPKTGVVTSPKVETNGESGEKSAAAAKVDEDKWCALCEQDGHLAFDCPNEQY